eukprot:6204329-Pleurochrysis_carterae.AAC.2
MRYKYRTVYGALGNTHVWMNSRFTYVGSDGSGELGAPGRAWRARAASARPFAASAASPCRRAQPPWRCRRAWRTGRPRALTERRRRETGQCARGRGETGRLRIARAGRSTRRGHAHQKEVLPARSGAVVDGLQRWDASRGCESISRCMS